MGGVGSRSIKNGDLESRGEAETKICQIQTDTGRKGGGDLKARAWR
jgi:hypothetical protein